MSIVGVVTAIPVPEHPTEVIKAFEAAIVRVHDEPGVELYPLHEGREPLVMIEKYESEQARSKHANGAAPPTSSPPWQASSAALSRRAAPPAPPGRKRGEGRAVTARRCM
ncbi:MAG TPA: antibiotic biosynthesis monooxygenase [Propionibacteriaceae bacterium]|jgi:quinol monooxygenase YgiN